MKEQVAKDWVKALRSGKYKQCTGHLKTKDGYCCLGVLSEISGFQYRPLSTGLSGVIRGWSGVTTRYGYFGANDLVTLNDKDRYSFNQIADLIEQNWEAI